jgi:hypothetical protein
VRALALVSAALPLPVIAVGCSSSSTTSQYPEAQGIQVQQEAGPPPGLSAGPEGGTDSGVTVAEAGGGVQALDAGASDAADDGGGPHRGTPELPASFLALLA